MKKISLILALLLVGCGFVYDKPLVGFYHLIAIDTDEQMSVSYDLGDGNYIGRINETVFSVGWNERYIVAKQHPNNNRSITNFYYLDIASDSKYADPSTSVVGPMSETEYSKKSKDLSLPNFSLTIKSLE